MAMTVGNISPGTPGARVAVGQAETRSPGGDDFARLLASLAPSSTAGEARSAGTAAPPRGQTMPSALRPLSLAHPRRAAAAYERQARPVTTSPGDSGFEKYKEDQLLKNPGGDRYCLERKMVLAPSALPTSFGARIRKDFTDALGNLKNAWENLFAGARFCYRDGNGRIAEARRRGCAASCLDFARDLAGALTLGHWRPAGEPPREGWGERLRAAAAHLKKALGQDLGEGVIGGLGHVAKNLLLAAWNLLEVPADATIGNVRPGREAVSAFFDNGQLAIEYLTDIMPGGDAWLRVHAPNLDDGRLPVVNNWRMAESGVEDARWRYVRNTPFRKKLETLGSLLVDGVVVAFLGPMRLLSWGARREQTKELS
jgi:hypothetical protein